MVFGKEARAKMDYFGDEEIDDLFAEVRGQVIGVQRAGFSGGRGTWRACGV
ncbi:hypothetical protein [Streptomyces heilongjiangensis]|uniref:Uncharacterized protein n=1 Tax=Streptomyces heilongjiangensis TaxID=945052 RepID=A0ABW1BJ40_9ACTN|nr:hypothetical protein [Streptomyces heilongjiangensis]MDC2951068.1 hypothetical protein [Streptomyces heilongjiangensis]